jgi:hypothetical protein
MKYPHHHAINGLIPEVRGWNYADQCIVCIEHDGPIHLTITEPQSFGTIVTEGEPWAVDELT